MKIEQHGNNELTIIGNIKSIEDSLEIKKMLDGLLQRGSKNITLKIQDSFSMTSTVIGHLMKLANLDKIPISLVVGDRRLYELLEELSLIQVFNIRLTGK